MTGRGSGRLPTNLRLENLGFGQAGNINISSKNVFLIEGGTILNQTYNRGNGGNIKLELSNDLNLIGSSEKVREFISILTTSSFSEGNAGNISIQARQINIFDGGTIASSAFSSGNGGNIILNVSELIRLNGVESRTLLPSSISATSTSSTFFEALRNGDGGQININSPKIIVENGGRIATSTFGRGNAGNIIINAESIEINGSFFNVLPSTINTGGTILPEVTRNLLGLPDLPSGDAGTLNINVSQLKINDGATVEVFNAGEGNAGTLNLNSARLHLSNKAQITSTSSSGRGGNIGIDSNLIFLEDSLISSSASGNNLTSNGGNITINTNVIVMKNSNIFARAVQGRGGDINISGLAVLLDSNSSIDASSQFGQDGEVNIETPQSLRNILAGIEKPSQFEISLQKPLNVCPEGTFQRGRFKITPREVPYTPQTDLDPYVLSIGARDNTPTASVPEKPTNETIPYILIHPQRYEPGFFYPRPNTFMKMKDGRILLATKGHARPETLQNFICPTENPENR